MNAEVQDELVDISKVCLVPDLIYSFIKHSRKSCQGLDVLSQAIFDNFFHNIEMMATTVSMPYLLTASSVIDHHYYKFFMSERIRTLNIPDGCSYKDRPRKSNDEVAKPIALDKLKEFVASDEGNKIILNGISDRLYRAIADDRLRSSIEELTRQGVVLLWCAFETMCRDVFVALLNADPKLLILCKSDQEFKKRFDVDKAFNVEVLEKIEFNLSGKIGEIIVSRQDMSDLVTIRTAYRAVFRNDYILNNLLTQDDLWKLCQKRHLLVHSGGKVDGKYIKATGEKNKLGDTILVSPESLCKCVELVCGVAERIFALMHTENPPALPGDPLSTSVA